MLLYNTGGFIRFDMNQHDFIFENFSIDTDFYIVIQDTVYVIRSTPILLRLGTFSPLLSFVLYKNFHSNFKIK